MKIQSRSASRVELMMTPMIDIVFQLLIFFIMSFQIATAEGDFFVQMPADGIRSDALDEETRPPLKVRLQADDDGRLAGIFVNDERMPSFREVREFAMRVTSSDRGPDRRPDAVRIEIDSDYGLRYAHVIEAVTAVSGFVGPDGTRVKLIENVKLATPRTSGQR